MAIVGGGQPRCAGFQDALVPVTQKGRLRTARLLLRPDIQRAGCPTQKRNQDWRIGLLPAQRQSHATAAAQGDFLRCNQARRTGPECSAMVRKRKEASAVTGNHRIEWDDSIAYNSAVPAYSLRSASQDSGWCRPHLIRPWPPLAPRRLPLGQRVRRAGSRRERASSDRSASSTATLRPAPSGRAVVHAPYGCARLSRLVATKTSSWFDWAEQRCLGIPPGPHQPVHRGRSTTRAAPRLLQGGRPAAPHVPLITVAGDGPAALAPLSSASHATCRARAFAWLASNTARRPEFPSRSSPADGGLLAERRPSGACSARFGCNSRGPPLWPAAECPRCERPGVSL